MSEPNKALARRWFEEVWNQRNTAAVHQFLSPETRCHTEQGPLIGPDAFLRHVYEPFLGAFPNFHIEIEGTMAAEDQVLVRWIAYGTHSGDGLGMPATHRTVTFPGLTWIRFRDGRFVEARDCWNVGGLLHALRGGPVPPSMTFKESPQSHKSRKHVCD